jgi:hypothetical protein
LSYVNWEAKGPAYAFGKVSVSKRTAGGHRVMTHTPHELAEEFPDHAQKKP